MRVQSNIAAPGAVSGTFQTPSRRVRRRVTRVSPLPASPAQLPVLSRASGEFPVDWDRARADAARTLRSIDWSRRSIVLWVPGTDSHTVHPDFARSVAQSFPRGSVSLARLEHAASWNIRPSVATGIATLRLVLAGIAAQTGNHRVMLAGESQGAWIIGEAMADPMLRRGVQRAVLLGHPWLARHQYQNGEDPGVRVINNPDDLITLPMRGDPDRGLDAMVAMHLRQLDKLPLIIRAIMENPLQGWKLLTSVRFAIPGLRRMRPNPHFYGQHMADAVTFLRGR